MIEISVAEAWGLIALLILLGGACYPIGIRVGVRIMRKVERDYAVSAESEDDARRALR